MTSGRPRIWLLAGAVAIGSAGLLATAAQAAVITQSVAVNIPAGRLDMEGVDVYVPNFDLSLGTLKYADVQFSGSLTPGFLGLHYSGSNPPEDITMTPHIMIAPGGVTQQFAPEFTHVFWDTFDVGGYPQSYGDANVGYPEDFNLGERLPASDFIGPPGYPPLTYPVLFYIDGGSGVPIGGSPGVPEVNYSNSTDIMAVNGTLSVSYVYERGHHEHIPEPSSIALMLAGLLGVGMIRRRRA